ncbi:DedA family protein [Kitasatospora sp. MBT63]|uniref:DedA family protein n=1 Tax=Kitasatospora sp. MBT63 TaxID=1444768 RepID=UPI000689D8D5|nr:DedA family protein [Kitasatospora sp. MBT63]
MTASLPGPLAQLAPLLDDYGYPAVGLLVFLDNCAVPVPGQTILVLAAVYAGTGRLSIAAVAVIAVLAAVAGDCLGYLIGRRGGPAFVGRWGRYLRLTPARMARAEHFFERRGSQVVLVARFVDGLRQANGIVAGAARMPWHRFLAANVAGAVLWVGVWAGAGYLAGDNIAALYDRAVRYQVYLLAALGLLVLALPVRWLLRRGRAGSGARSRRPGAAQPRSGTTSKDDA